jgi:hypothetical protein
MKCMLVVRTSVIGDVVFVSPIADCAKAPAWLIEQGIDAPDCT